MDVSGRRGSPAPVPLRLAELISLIGSARLREEVARGKGAMRLQSCSWGSISLATAAAAAAGVTSRLATRTTLSTFAWISGGKGTHTTAMSLETAPMVRRVKMSKKADVVSTSRRRGASTSDDGCRTKSSYYFATNYPGE